MKIAVNTAECEEKMDAILEMLDEIRPEFDFKNSRDFMKDGLLDSFDIVSLVSMLEEKYNIRIDGLDIVPENFSTLEGIAGVIRKSGGDL